MGKNFVCCRLSTSVTLGGIAAGLIGVASRVWWGRRMATGGTAGVLLLFIALGAIVGGVSFWAASEFRLPALLWLGVALHGVTVLGANVVVMSGVMKYVPSERVGAATGIVSMGDIATSTSACEHRSAAGSFVTHDHVVEYHPCGKMSRDVSHQDEKASFLG